MLDSDGESYDVLARQATENAGLVALNEGKDCPPSRATFIRLAVATDEGNGLSAELKTLLLHTDDCPVCGRTLTGLLSLMRATPREGVGGAADEISFDGKPLRALFNAAKSVSYVGVEDRSAGNLFRMVYEAAKLTEEEAFDALGMDSTTSDDEVIDCLCCLGVPAEVLGLS